MSESSVYWGHSSAGRAPALHAGGRRFDPAWLHQSFLTSYPRGIVTHLDATERQPLCTAGCRNCDRPTFTPRISPCSLNHENAQPLPAVSPKLSRAIPRSFNDQAYSITDAPLKSAASYLFESDGTAQTKHFFGLGQSRLRFAYAH